ncbi:hypothetical protein SAMN05421594_2626 [Chryseobacterium oleae]|uniref:C1q domain-containing protein n=2 Tax=Chryseobacterium oleae TaxID=491207 RepID=A0A1I4YRB8_CHROL|nr:hypothetical protein SAMN05421594_2626 [Chryseobacterium oleae]
MFSVTLAYSQVGINTANPQGILHIDGAKDNPATGTGSIAQQANDVIVKQTGNVGIGTENPTAKLEISSGLAGSSGLKFTGMNSSSTATLDASGLGVDANGNVVVQGTVQKARFKGYVSTYSPNLPANNSPDSGPTTQLSFDENFDVGNNFSGNVFTAPRTGFYIVNTHLLVDSSINWGLEKNELYLDVRVDGNAVLTNTNIFSVSSSTAKEGPSVSINGLVQMNAGQQLTVYAWMFNNNIERKIGYYRTSLSIGEL